MCYGLMFVCLSVCPSQPVFYRNCWTDWTCFWHRGYPRLILHWIIREFDICKNNGSCLLRVCPKLKLADFLLSYRHCTSIDRSVVKFVQPTTVASLSYWAFTFVYNTKAWRTARRAGSSATAETYSLSNKLESTKHMAS